MYEKNRDTITKQQVMHTVLKYLGDTPFDAEKFSLIISDTIHDTDIDLYIDDIVFDYEQGEQIQEVEVWSFLFDHAHAIFADVFAAYYSDSYIEELFHLAEQEYQVSSTISDIISQDLTQRNAIKTRYIAQIQRAFDSYPSSPARQSLIAGAQKILISELIKEI